MNYNTDGFNNRSVYINNANDANRLRKIWIFNKITLYL